MSSAPVSFVSVGAVLLVTLVGQAAVAQSSAERVASGERPFLIFVTKDRLHISTDNKLPSGVNKKDLGADGLLIRCNSCELDRQDGEKKTFTIECRGDVLVESSLVTIRAETVLCEGTNIIAVGTEEKGAELWAVKDASKKQTAFTTSASEIRFSLSKRTIEVANGLRIEIGQQQ